DCEERYPLSAVINSEVLVPICSSCNGIIRPDVVLYEEPLDADIVDRAIDYIKNADMLIVGGSSLEVNPAASFINHYEGDRLVLINKSSTPFDDRANLVIKDSIGKVLERVVS